MVSESCNKKHSGTHVKIQKINNLFPIDIDRVEQVCAAHYKQVVMFIVCNTTFPSLSLI
jgi:hypothetical protein